MVTLSKQDLLSSRPHKDQPHQPGAPGSLLEQNGLLLKLWFFISAAQVWDSPGVFQEKDYFSMLGQCFLLARLS